MYCKKCGCELTDGARFCKKCGAPIEAKPAQEEPVMAEPIKEEPIKEEPIKAEPANDMPTIEQPVVGDYDSPVTVELPVVEKDKKGRSAKVKAGSKPGLMDSFAGFFKNSGDSNKLTIVLIAILAVAIIAAIIAGIYILKLGSDSKPKPKDEVAQEIQEEPVEPSEPEETHEEEITEEPAVETESESPVIDIADDGLEEETEEDEIVFEDWDVDIDGECYHIYDEVSGFEHTKGNYEHKTIAGERVHAYVYNGEALIMDIQSGFNGWNCERSYYGVDAFYAKIYDYDTGCDYELFYKEGKLIRCIENGVIHDYNTDNWAYYNDIGVRAAQEKNELKKYI